MEEPLFKGYLFIQIEDKRRDEVFLPVRYLFWLRRPALVREQEIATIQKWLRNYGHDCIQVSAIYPGHLRANYFW